MSQKSLPFNASGTLSNASFNVTFGWSIAHVLNCKRRGLLFFSCAERFDRRPAIDKKKTIIVRNVRHKIEYDLLSEARNTRLTWLLLCGCLCMCCKVWNHQWRRFNSLLKRTFVIATFCDLCRGFISAEIIKNVTLKCTRFYREAQFTWEFCIFCLFCVCDGCHLLCFIVWRQWCWAFVKIFLSRNSMRCTALNDKRIEKLIDKLWSFFFVIEILVPYLSNCNFVEVFCRFRVAMWYARVCSPVLNCCDWCSLGRRTFSNSSCYIECNTCNFHNEHISSAVKQLQDIDKGSSDEEKKSYSFLFFIVSFSDTELWWHHRKIYTFFFHWVLWSTHSHTWPNTPKAYFLE